MAIENRPAVQTAAYRGPLLVRLCNWVGEVVLSLPALRRLHDAGFALHLFGKGWAPALLEGCGWPVTVRQHGLGATIAQLRALRGTLAGTDRAPALLLTKSLSSALETRCAGFRPEGYAYDGRSLLLTRAHRLSRVDHMALSYWRLVDGFLGASSPMPTALDWSPSPAQHAKATALLAMHGLVRGHYVLFCPFSGSDDRENAKVWPGFEAIAQSCWRRGLPVVVCPGPGEENTARALLPNATCLTGIDLGMYGALTTLAYCTIANDTGPGHLAAAAGARLISVYGPRSTRAWTPIGPGVTVLGDPHGWPSIDEVEAELWRARADCPDHSTAESHA
jgi:heptosyltransferase-2